MKHSLSPRATRALLLSFALCAPAAYAQQTPVTARAATVRAFDPAQTNALKDAIKNRRVDAARAAIAAGADVNAKDKGGVTFLMRASETLQTELVELLLRSGADASALDKKGQNALFYALPADPKPKKKSGFGKFLKAAGGVGSMMLGGGMLGGFGSLLGGNLTSLLGGGAFNPGDKSGWKAIAGAAMQGDANGKSAAELLSRQMLPGSGLDAAGWTSLISSAKNAQPEILGAMNNLGADGGLSPETKALWSQFVNAAASGDQKTVERLMANPQLAPLLQHAGQGLGAATRELPGNASQAIIPMLLARGANPSVANRDGDTPAEIAQKRGLNDIAALFVGP